MWKKATLNNAVTQSAYAENASFTVSSLDLKMQRERHRGEEVHLHGDSPKEMKDGNK